LKTNANTQSQDGVNVGLSATPNAAAKDLGAMLSAGNTAAADTTQAATSGTDTFGNLLSDRLAQDAARRRADAQSAADDASRRADIARQDAARSTAASNDQGATSADSSTPVQAVTAPASSTVDAASAKPAQPVNAKDLDTAAQQAVVDPAAQLAAQIEAARQAALQTAAAQQPVAQPAAQSNTNTDTGATTQASGKSSATDAAALAAANAAANGMQGATDRATAAQSGQAGLPAAKDTKANAANTPTPPAAVLPDSSALAQTMARTRAVADNTPAAVRQLGSTSSAQGTNADHGLPRRTDLNVHSPATQTAAVTDATSHAGNGGNTDNAGTQANAQSGGTQFQGVLSRANADANMAAPTFALGGTNAGAAAVASIAPQQVHTLPTFGDAGWPQSMASQLAFMQVHKQSSAELQLNPAELGGMHVKLEVDNGAVNASFVCQHQAVAELVQDAMPRLRDAMQQGGMQLAQTSVSTGDFSQQQNASQGASAQNQGSRSGNGGNGSNGSRYGSSGSQDRIDTAALAPRRASSHEGAIDTFA
jgi:flagellar hook-length control protein FliK